MTKKYRRRKALTGIRTVFTVKNPTLREPVADDVLRAAVEAKDYRVTSVD